MENITGLEIAVVGLNAALFILLFFLTIIGSKKSPKIIQRKVDYLSMDTISYSEIKDDATRSDYKESFFALFGHREQDDEKKSVYRTSGMRRIEGETKDIDEGNIARYALGDRFNAKPPQGRETIGYVHRHIAPTPVDIVPENLLKEYRGTHPRQQILFPSKADSKYLGRNRVLIITSPAGDMKAWARDADGKIYSPSIKMDMKEESVLKVRKKSTALVVKE